MMDYGLNDSEVLELKLQRENVSHPVHVKSWRALGVLELPFLVWDEAWVLYCAIFLLISNVK